MATATVIVNAALRKLGRIKYGQVANDNQLAAGLECLKNYLGELANEDLMVPFLTVDSFTLVIGTGTYTIGPTGSVVKTRPVQIQGAFVRSSTSYDRQVDIIPEDVYRRIRDKTTTGRPSVAWYNPTTPDGTLYLAGVPEVAEDFYYMHPNPFPEPATIGADVVIPRGYDMHVGWGVAELMAVELGIDPPPLMVMKKAASSRKKILSLNAARRVAPAVLNVTIPRETFNISEGASEGAGGLLLE